MSQVLSEIKGVYKLPEIVCKILFVCMYIFWEDSYPSYISNVFWGKCIHSLNQISERISYHSGKVINLGASGAHTLFFHSWVLPGI